MKEIRPKTYFSKFRLSVFLIIFAVLGAIVIIRTFAAPNPNLQGDLNNDNTVNITDLSILLSNYGTTSSTADINGDSTVNILDLSILLSHYGNIYTPSTSMGSALPALLGESTGSQLFISPVGSGMSCTQTSPCTMQQAINNATPGQTIEALGGTYSVNIVWNPSGGNGHSGTPTSPITLENYSGQNVIVHAASNASEMFRITGGASFIRIRGLMIEANPSLWTGTGRQALYVSGVGGAHDIDIVGNDFSGYDAGTTTGHDLTPFLAGPGATHINLIGNKCHNWGNGSAQRQCFYIQADSGLVANNLVYGDPNGFGIQIRADSSAVKDCAIIVTNNTVVDIHGQRGIYVEANCKGAIIRNNIVAYSGAEEIYGLFTSDDSVDPPVSSNRAYTNLVWDTAGSLTGNTSGHSILDFTNGSGNYSGPGDNIKADPLFVNRNGYDFHLTSNSPAIGKSDISYCLPFDFSGKARDSAPDLGALEF